MFVLCLFIMYTHTGMYIFKKNMLCLYIKYFQNIYCMYLSLDVINRDKSLPSTN